jgi:hypothetical protein
MVRRLQATVIELDRTGLMSIQLFLDLGAGRLVLRKPAAMVQLIRGAGSCAGGRKRTLCVGVSWRA